MIIHKLKTHQGIPDGRHEHVVILWEEDDASRAARDDTRLQVRPNTDADWCERTRMGAWKAITGMPWGRDEPVAEYDGGDWLATLYPGGWVRAFSPEGESIGVAVEIVP